MPKQHLYIIRHGETEFNKLNIVQGSGVDTDLNEQGNKQAELFYSAYCNHPFDIVYTSALKRTHQSVKQFLNSGLKHIVLPELNEISWGVFEGQQQTEAQRMIYWETINHWNSGSLDVKIPEGESPVELQQRQQRALQQILEDKTHEHILICMHGRAMKSFLCLLLDLPLTEMEKFQHSNLCLYHVSHTGNRFELVTGNNTEHLVGS
jgi:broad specificity phosphatase PhoE